MQKLLKEFNYIYIISQFIIYIRVTIRDTAITSSFKGDTPFARNWRYDWCHPIAKRLNFHSGIKFNQRNLIKSVCGAEFAAICPVSLLEEQCYQKSNYFWAVTYCTVYFTHLGLEYILTIVDYYPSRTPSWNQKSVKTREQDHLSSDFIL